ncbi:hypothetical protein BDR06DRAFT_1015742 [Suillus hirtellus]|nr:hypothetical protein BDR06DRAFT_1015742 [Suillus hirtellus]
MSFKAIIQQDIECFDNDKNDVSHTTLLLEHNHHQNLKDWHSEKYSSLERFYNPISGQI